MHLIYSALIVDDDPIACAFMKWFLEDRFPYLRVATSTEPKAVHGFSLYFLDNDFGGDECAVDLVQKIRGEAENAFISVFSARLDTAAFKQLLNAGCDGAFEKGKPGELSVLESKIRAYLYQRELRASQVVDRGFTSTFKAMTGLVTGWNQRLNATVSHKGGK